MGVTTVVTGSFSADHHRPYGKYRHGHDWHVRVWVEAGRHKDAVQERLDIILGALDHKFLDALISDPSNEGVSKWIGQQLDAARVYVWRYDKGREFGGEWRA